MNLEKLKRIERENISYHLIKFKCAYLYSSDDSLRKYQDSFTESMLVKLIIQKKKIHEILIRQVQNLSIDR